MTVRKATLYRFYNEATMGSLKNLGCGYRTVICLPPGRKWVSLVDWTTLDVATITIQEWARMKPTPVEYRAGRVLSAMKERIPYKFGPTEDGKPGKPTGTIKEAMALLKEAA